MACLRNVAVGWLVLATGCLPADPVQTLPDLGPIDLASVTVGAFHACGLDPAGRAFCWGGNALGQAGVGDQDDHLQPISVAQGEIRFARMFAGAAHTCAIITTTNRVACWGSNSRGQLGTGQQQAGGIQTGPGLLVGADTFTAADGDGGDQHSCIVTRDREAFCWGAAEVGQLGSGLSGPQEFRGAPQTVLGGHLFEEVTTGAEHTCGRTVAGAALCWGQNERGQLGTGDNTNATEPVAVIGGHVFAFLDAGGSHTCGVTVDNDAYCWGENSVGQLGIGSSADRAEPTLVAGGIDFADVSAGGNHTCGLTTSGDVYCWGLNNAGQLGDGTLLDRNVPVPINSAESFTFVQAGTGEFDTVSCGLSVSDLVYCWGYGGSGQVGDGSGDNQRSPTLVRRQPVP